MKDVNRYTWGVVCGVGREIGWQGKMCREILSFQARYARQGDRIPRRL